jgi:preprotein translocase subunit SecF
MLNIITKRYYFFALSFLLILPGLIIISMNGVPLSIDFEGGSLIELEIPLKYQPSRSDFEEIYSTYSISDFQYQTSENESSYIVIIKSTTLAQDQYSDLISEIRTFYGPDLVERRFNTVGPTISQSVTQRALLAIAIASIAVVLYITFAFRGISHAFRYGICAIIAMFHDILIVISISAIGSKLFGWEMDSLFLTALLTVIGFSTQDKIVVFDRIRENAPVLRKISFEKLVNHSIIQSLQRSINTQLMTVEFLLLSLALFGGDTIQQMSIILLVGLLSGTYSSIFIAAPLLVVWENRDWKSWFKGPSKSQVT